METFSMPLTSPSLPSFPLHSPISSLLQQVLTAMGQEQRGRAADREMFK